MDPAPNDLRINRLFGAMLMAFGALLVVLSGLCSAGVLATTIIGAVAHPGTLDSQGAASFFGFLFMVGLFGGVPAVCGLFMFRVGRKLRST